VHPGKAHGNQARQILEDATKADAEYASMARWPLNGPR
jgi:hypothetical protein